MAVTVPVIFEEATLSKLDELAQDIAQPRDRLVAEAIESYVEFYAAQVAKIKEGIAQADRGEFASEEEVARVFAKYRAR
jgi:predicted transcriptional regulator